MKKLIFAFVLNLVFALSALAGDVILHFSDFGPPEAASGSATVMKNLQNEQTKAGKTVYLVLPEYDARRFPTYRNPEHIIRIPRSGGFQKSEGYQKLVEMFLQGEIEAVHVHKEANFSRLGLSLARKFGVPTVLTAHMMIGPFMKDHFANKPKPVKPIFDYLGRRVEADYIKFANSFDVVTAPTDIVKEYLIKAGVTRPILVIAPGGVPVERFSYTLKPDRSYLSAQPDILTDKSNQLEKLAEGVRSGKTVAEAMGPEQPGRPRKVVVMLARLSAEKGIEHVLGAWEKVIADPRFDYQFVLAGLGGVNSDSKRIYAELQAHPQAGKTIHYVGSLPYEEVPRLLSGGDVIVSASHHETFGLALIEAGAAGRPVIVPDLPAFRTFLKDGDTGLFVDKVNEKTLPDALTRLFGDGGATYERMSKAARANAELYSTAHVTAETFNSYSLASEIVRQHARSGESLKGNYFQTPLTTTQMCRWVMINLLTKP